MRRFIVSTVAFMTGLLAFTANVYAAQTAKYSCQTTDKGIKIFFDFTVEYDKAAHKVVELSASYGNPFIPLFPRQIDEPQAIAGDQISGHIRMMADSNYGFLPIRLTVDMDRAPEERAEDVLGKEAVHRSAPYGSGGALAGPEVPWPLLDGWVKIESMLGSHSRPMTCLLSGEL